MNDGFSKPQNGAPNLETHRLAERLRDAYLRSISLRDLKLRKDGSAEFRAPNGDLIFVPKNAVSAIAHTECAVLDERLEAVVRDHEQEERRVLALSTRER